jgi:hypothetical protein
MGIGADIRKNILGIKSPSFWRYVVNIWSLLLFAVVICDFIYNNMFIDIVGPLAAIYTAALAIYSTEKEFKRWRDYYTDAHPGELYVIVWTLIVGSILILDATLSKPYRMPQEVISAYIVVLGILAVTKNSKFLYKKKKRKGL